MFISPWKGLGKKKRSSVKKNENFFEWPAFLWYMAIIAISGVYKAVPLIHCLSVKPGYVMSTNITNFSCVLVLFIFSSTFLSSGYNSNSFTLCDATCEDLFLGWFFWRPRSSNSTTGPLQTPLLLILSQRLSLIWSSCITTRNNWGGKVLWLNSFFTMMVQYNTWAVTDASPGCCSICTSLSSMVSESPTALWTRNVASDLSALSLIPAFSLC